MSTKRLNIEFDGHQYFLIIDKVYERCLARLDTRLDALAWLEMYKMLSEENEQLKTQLNYIQNSISEHIKHQKTELGQKALKEVIEDYNEWLLGHKELEE